MKLAVLGLLSSLLLSSVARAAEPAPAAAVEVESSFPVHRYSLVGGGLFLLGGLGFGWVAQGTALRAQTLSGARDTQRALAEARAEAASANVLLGLAGLTLAYGLVLELLPPEIAEKATLTFHF